MPDTQGSIFEKLTDPSSFTGHHRHRFDKRTGKGRGLAGRDRISKGHGTDLVPPSNAHGDITDIAQLMRPHLNTSGNKKPDGTAARTSPSRSRSPAARRRGKSPRPASSKVYNRLTDPNGFTGAHRHRFDPETGQGRGLDGRDSISKGGGTIASFAREAQRARSPASASSPRQRKPARQLSREV